MADRIGDRGKATALAGAVRSDNPEDFARSYRPADVTQRNQRAIAHRQVFNPQHLGAVTRCVSPELATPANPPCYLGRLCVARFLISNEHRICQEVKRAFGNS